MLELSVDKLLSWSLHPKITEGKLLQGIVDISSLYTRERDELDNWQWNESLITSYTCFYLPTNFVKLKFILDRLPEDVLSELASSDWIDFGCGPGTYSLALLDYFEEFKGKIHCVDKESFMLEQAMRVIRGAFPDKLSKVSFSGNALDNDFKSPVMVFGNSINEMRPSDVNSIIKKVKPKFVIFIEPGTPEVYYKLMDVRRKIGNENYKNIFPCPSTATFCPLLEQSIKEERVDWCHQVLKHVHHPSVERLGQIVKLDRKKMPLIGHLYQYIEDDFRNIEENSFRIIRTVSESKHSFVWDVCLLNEVNENLNLRFEVPKRKMAKSRAKELGNASAGDIFKYELIKEINDSLWRVSLV